MVLSMKFFKYITFVLTILIFYPEVQTNAQLYGILADTVRVTDSLEYGGKDIIYIYNASEALKNLDNCRGTLKAKIPNKLTNLPLHLVWSKYDFEQKKFIGFDSSYVSSGDSSIKKNLLSGGYQVRITRYPIDITFRAWIFINKLRLHLKKNSEGSLNRWNFNCKYITLGVILYNINDPDNTQCTEQCDGNLCDSLCKLWYIHNKFIYANPLTGNTITLKNDTTVIWSAYAMWFGDTLSNKTFESAPQNNLIVIKPPPDTTTFTINFSDEYHNSATDYVIFNSIYPRSLFDIKVSDNNQPDSTSSIGEAPLKAKFTNKSLNAKKFEWILADTFQQSNLSYNRNDSAHFTISKSDTNSVHYTYYIPNIYNVRLISYGPGNTCTSDTLPKKIRVYYSELGSTTSSHDTLRFPNAFSPGNNDKINDIFFYKTDNPTGNTIYETWKSIKSLHLMIFNILGKLVFEHEGPVLLDGKDGWNGTTLYGSKAPTGVYYYYYEAVGYGNFIDKSQQISSSSDTTVQTSNSNKLKGSGYVYLFRKR